jgi:hypothetical protein
MKAIRTVLFLGGMIIKTIFSCKKDKTFCGCGKENPIKNIDWLSSFITFYDNDTIHHWDQINLYMYDYKNSNAFIFETKKTGEYDVPLSVQNCEGTTIFICGGLQPPQVDSCNIFFQSASNKKLIWSKTNKYK